MLCFGSQAYEELNSLVYLKQVSKQMNSEEVFLSHAAHAHAINCSPPCGFGQAAEQGYQDFKVELGQLG